jgi:S1-C subfamily serine protease
MNGRGANLTLVLCVAGCLMLPACDRPSESLQEQEAEAPPTEEKASGALKYPRGAESLAEMNPHGIHYFHDGVSIVLDNRDPLLDSTAFGRKALELSEELARPLPAWPRRRKLTAEQVYAESVPYQNSEEKNAKVVYYRLVKAAAEMGHAEAQASLAICYINGIGVPKNPLMGARWAEKSGKNGNATGAAVTYEVYAKGIGVKKDKEKARRFLLASAEGGNAYSKKELGFHLLVGKKKDPDVGITVDTKSARKWLIEAAKAPVDVWQEAKMWAINILGYMHDNGLGVPPNETEALAHYYLAKSISENMGDVEAINRNISLRERQMTSSARQFSQLRAQELRPLYFESSASDTSAPLAEQLKYGSGSGVFVTQEGHLLTAAHVVENAAKVKARLNEETVEAEIIAVDHPNDVALLKVHAKVDAAPIRPSAGVELGNQVFTIGFPNMLLQGTEPKFTEGTISSTSGMRDDPRQFQVSVQVQPGNSGGALFDENGNVVGLVVSKLDDIATTKLTGAVPQNVNYAVKSSYALPLLESLKVELMAEHRRPWFGGNRDQVVSRAKKSSVPLIVELKAPRQ